MRLGNVGGSIGRGSTRGCGGDAHLMTEHLYTQVQYKACSFNTQTSQCQCYINPPRSKEYVCKLGIAGGQGSFGSGGRLSLCLCSSH